MEIAAITYNASSDLLFAQIWGEEGQEVAKYEIS